MADRRYIESRRFSPSLDALSAPPLGVVRRQAARDRRAAALLKYAASFLAGALFALLLA